MAKILLVEDNEMNRDMLSRRLERRGYGAKAGVSVSATAWERIKDIARGQSLGRVPVKGKGEMEIFRVDEIRS